MKPHAVMLAKILTYSSTLPFAAAVMSRYAPLPGVNDVSVVTTYGAVIISFLCGMHWATYLFFASQCPRNLLITSNAVALLAWMSVLIHQPIATLSQALCFLYLLTLDLKLRDADILPGWFYSLRRNATIIVVLCLSIRMVLA